jgi:hypothetical protein
LAYCFRPWQRPGEQLDTVTIPESYICDVAQQMILLLATHASRAGVGGPVLAQVSLEPGTGGRAVLSESQFIGDGPIGERSLDRPALGERMSIDLAACAVSKIDVLLATRRLLSHVFQALGLAEVRPIDSRGLLRVKHFRDSARAINWSADHGIEVNDRFAWECE